MANVTLSNKDSVMIVYDIRNRMSFDSARDLVPLVRAVNKNFFFRIINICLLCSIWYSMQSQMYQILAGNCCDDEETREITYEEVARFASQQRIEFWECSAKTGYHVNEIFQACLDTHIPSSTCNSLIISETTPSPTSTALSVVGSPVPLFQWFVDISQSIVTTFSNYILSRWQSS